MLNVNKCKDSNFPSACQFLFSNKYLKCVWYDRSMCGYEEEVQVFWVIGSYEKEWNGIEEIEGNI